MANVLAGNTYYVETVSSSASTSLVSDDIQLLGVVYSTDTANQYITLNDISGQGAVGNLKLKVGNGLERGSRYIDLSANPIRFTEGIWISAIDSGVATLIVKLK